MLKENIDSMHVKLYGTRGSCPVSGADYVEFGGNTTCLRVLSPCIPSSMALVIDAGSGYRECSCDILADGILKVGILQTHYHHDHIQGFPFAPHTYVPGCLTTVWGIKEHGVGPAEAYNNYMKSPWFPKDFEEVRHQYTSIPMEPFTAHVMVIHPKGGVKLVKMHTFRKQDRPEGQLKFTKNEFGVPGSYAIDECIVIWMYKARHPERTISFRLEERPTGKVFVILTDHEAGMGWSSDLLSHLREADLLLQDGQYNHEEYLKKYVGWGHGTPVYCANTAIQANVKRLGLTHHDPKATDDDIHARLDEARAELKSKGCPDLAESCFAARDFQVIKV